MDRHHNPRRNSGAKGMADNIGSIISKFVYDLSRASGRWEDQDYYVGPEVSSRITRVSYSSYFDENGKLSGFTLSSQTHDNPATAPGDRIQLDGDSSRRVDGIHARLRR